MYKILCSGFGFGSSRTGVSEYIRSTIELLCNEHQVDLLLPEYVEYFPVSSPNLNIIRFPLKCRGNWYELFWHHYVLPRKIDFSGYDFCFLPMGVCRIFNRIPITTIMTIHNLPTHCSRGTMKWYQRLYFRYIVPACVRRADMIMAISKYTARMVKRYYGIPDEKVVVNYNGFDVSRFYNSPLEDDTKIMSKFGLTENYILYTAAIGLPGKEHLNLIKAYELLPERLKASHHLVLAGELIQGVSDEVLHYADASADRSRIHLIGFVEDAYIPALIRKAFVYAFPSVCEGFGIPMVEAMSCGIPVISSNRASLPEIGGRAILTFDSSIPEEIRDCMVSVMTDNALKNELIKAGYTRKEMFSWKNHVDKLIQAFEEYKGGMGL